MEVSDNEDRTTNVSQEEENSLPNELVNRTLELYEIFGNMLYKFSIQDRRFRFHQKELNDKIESLRQYVAGKEYNEILEEVEHLKETMKKDKTENGSKLENMFNDNEIRFEENKFEPCNKCWKEKVRTTKFCCGDSFCSECMFNEYELESSLNKNKKEVKIMKPRLHKCLNPCCFYILDDEEYSRVIGTISEPQSFKADYCLICGKMAKSTVISCDDGHKICQRCFKQYGEYVTKHKVLIVQSKLENRIVYEQIPCPEPNCKNTISIENLIELFTFPSRELYARNAKKDYDNSLISQY